MIAVHARKGIKTSRAGNQGGQYKTYFIGQKTFLALQTLALVTLGKWATTHEKVVFLGKKTALGLCCLDRSDFKCQ